MAADVHQEAGVATKVCAEERALDLGDEDYPDVGLLAKGEGEVPRWAGSTLKIRASQGPK